jgi:hypothetical protein
LVLGGSVDSEVIQAHLKGFSSAVELSDPARIREEDAKAELVFVTGEEGPGLPHERNERVFFMRHQQAARGSSNQPCKHGNEMSPSNMSLMTFRDAISEPPHKIESATMLIRAFKIDSLSSEVQKN